MTLRTVLIACLSTFVVASCAPPPPRAPVPESEDYVFPVPAAGALGRDESKLEQAWRAVLAGDAARAERDLRRLLSRHPGSPAVQTALAYAALRGGRAVEAQANFDAVLAAHPDYVAAVIGSATLAARRGDLERALALHRRAAELAPSEPAPAARIPELRLQVADRRIGLAQQALRAERGDEAIEHFQVALEAAPEVAGVRLELANLLAARGDATTAIALLRGDPGQDPGLALRAAELLEQDAQWEAAQRAYEELLARDPASEPARAGLERVTATRQMLGMPPEYRQIFAAPRITRADLAALVAIRLAALERLPAEAPPVAIDISGSWARDHILRTLSHGLFDLLPNHTFQPGSTVRRADLAVVLQRVLDRAGAPPQPAPPIADVPRGTPAHYAVSRAVGAGLLALTPSGAFEPWRPVSGEEAARAIDALSRRLAP